MTLNLHRSRRFLDNAFGWIMHNLELFNPFPNMIEVTGPDTSLNKALVELGLMCMLYRRCIEGNSDPRIENFISFIHDIWQRPDYQERAVRNPEAFRFYVMVNNTLLHSGTIESSYHEIIQRILDQGYVTATEATPMQVLDLHLMLDTGGFRHNLPSYDNLYQATFLAKMPPLLYFTNEDVYCITHTLFYLTDFSFHPVSAIPAVQLPAVCWTIGTLLGIYLRHRHWDLVGELLLNCECLRWSPPFIFESAWHSLLDAQLPDGSIPGPGFSNEKMQQLNELERKTYCFEQNYHTTLVGALACFLTHR